MKELNTKEQKLFHDYQKKNIEINNCKNQLLILENEKLEIEKNILILFNEKGWEEVQYEEFLYYPDFKTSLHKTNNEFYKKYPLYTKTVRCVSRIRLLPALANGEKFEFLDVQRVPFLRTVLL